MSELVNLEKRFEKALEKLERALANNNMVKATENFSKKEEFNKTSNKNKVAVVYAEGNIVDVCPMKGCWIEIKDSDSDQIIRVKVQDDIIIFPQDSKGKKVIVNGGFKKIEFSEKQALKWKIHLAEEKGLKLEESDVTLDSTDLIE